MQITLTRTSLNWTAYIMNGDLMYPTCVSSQQQPQWLNYTTIPVPYLPSETPFAPAATTE